LACDIVTTQVVKLRINNALCGFHVLRPIPFVVATAPTVNADGTPRPTYINLPHDNEQEDDENNKYNIEKLRANRLKSHAYDEIDGKYL